MATIEALTYVLPEDTLTDEDIAAAHPDWKIRRISATTGIHTRHVATDGVFSSDLATQAVKRLLDESKLPPSEVDYLILCTQSPDFPLPTTACIVQHAAGLPTTVGALDVNLGCSGFVYSLALANGLIASGQARRVIVVTVETHSKFANPNDKATRPIFGDAAAAVLVSDAPEGSFDGWNFGTDGSGAGGLVVPGGRLRAGADLNAESEPETRGLDSNGFDMYMDGTAIFNFTLREVPKCVRAVVERSDTAWDDVDLFVFHQANHYLIEHLRKKLEIPEQKFMVALDGFGNTRSSTIPIALAEAQRAGRLHRGDKVLLCGFGVGLSWAGVLVTW